MNTAKQNIALLPDWCYGVLPEDKSLIRIKSGEMGYYPMKGDKTFIEQGMELHKAKDTSELADILNKERNVNKAQRKAMEMGSMFGWEHGAANPETYDENGNFKKN